MELPGIFNFSGNLRERYDEALLASYLLCADETKSGFRLIVSIKSHPGKRKPFEGRSSRVAALCPNRSILEVSSVLLHLDIRGLIRWVEKQSHATMEHD